MALCKAFFALFALFSIASAYQLRFTQISTTFNSPIAADYDEVANNLLTSAFYFYGSPYNFIRINFDGTQSQFSTVSGLSDEIKIAMVRSGNVGGYPAGDGYTGNGQNAQILRIASGGTRIITTWCVLPGPATSIGLMRGSLYVDRTGVFGGDLLVVTTGGYAFRVPYGDASCGTPVVLGSGSVGTHLEGCVSVPNSPEWGTMAGKLIAGAEGQLRLYWFAATGGTSGFWNTNPVAIEDLDYITPGENFFGVNYGTGRMLGVDWTQFQTEGMTSKILATMEFYSLWVLEWDSTTSAPKLTNVATAPGSPAIPNQWEHVTFAPVGVREILPPNWSLCMRGTGGLQTEAEIKLFSLTSPNTDVSNYRYTVPNGNPLIGAGTIPSGSINMFFTQDYTNRFCLTIIIKSSSAGSLSLTMRETNAASATSNPVIRVFDDQPNTTPGGGDSADTYFFDGSDGSFRWNYGAGNTDGVSIGSFDFVTIASPFTMTFTITAVTGGVDTWRFMTPDASNNPTALTIATGSLAGQTFTINRRSCSCGNNVLDSFEVCDDGGLCCNEYCQLRPAGYTCRNSAGVCDVEDVCTGTSSACVDGFVAAGTSCRASAGICDLPEACTGSSASCPADSFKGAENICRDTTGVCDVAENCPGNSADCPADSFREVGFACDDGSNCTDASACTAEHECVGQDIHCGGLCGDRVLANQEQCDTALSDICCTPACRFASNARLCRASTGRCDPPEYCSGASGVCVRDNNTTCPTCPGGCNEPNGQCVSPTWTPGDEVCECTNGLYRGDNCEIPACEQFSTCDTCSSHPECGWCCSTGRCVQANSNMSAPYDSTQCPTGQWQGHTCNCNPNCTTNGGTCSCGTCICEPGQSGTNCEFIIDCFGDTYPVGTRIAVIDVCNVCGGNGSTCIGCDGIPYGLEYDRCGDCGGDGTRCWNRCDGFDSCSDCTKSEQCTWCKTGKEICASSNVQDTYTECTEWITGDCPLLGTLTVKETAGLGAGVIAAIAIGAAAFVILAGVGGKKGYDVWMANRNNLQGASTSPIYTDNGLTGTNPLHEK